VSFASAHYLFPYTFVCHVALISSCLLYIFLSAFLSTLLSACLSVRSVCLSVRQPTPLSYCSSVFLHACLLVYLSASLPTLLTRLPVSLSVRLSVSHTWCAEGLMVSDTLHAVLPAGFAWNPRRVECGLNSIQSRPRGPLSLLLLGPSNTFLVVQFRRRNVAQFSGATPCW
jgi:hypothetical protein